MLTVQGNFNFQHHRVVGPTSGKGAMDNGTFPVFSTILSPGGVDIIAHKTATGLFTESIKLSWMKFDNQVVI